MKWLPNMKCLLNIHISTVADGKFGWSRRNIPLQQFLIFIALWVRKYFIILKSCFQSRKTIFLIVWNVSMFNQILLTSIIQNIWNIYRTVKRICMLILWGKVWRFPSRNTVFVTWLRSNESLRRIPLNVRAISAKNIYQKTTHSTVTL